MPNQGFHVDGTTEMEADALNAAMLQRDTAVNRPAAGQTGRLFWDTANNRLERDNGASWDVIFQTDPAAATPGLRTLGTGAAQASAGNHSHTISQAAVGEQENVTVNVPISEPAGTDHDGASVSRTPGASGRTIVVQGSARPTSALDGVYTVRLFKDGASVASVSITDNQYEQIVQYTDVGPTVASHTYKVVVRNENIPSAGDTFITAIGFVEVYNS